MEKQRYTDGLEQFVLQPEEINEIFDAEYKYDEDIQEHDNTVFTNDCIHDFLSSLKNYPVLSRDEVNELIKKAQQEQDIEARDKLICHNLKLVVNVARKYGGVCNYSNIEFMDLIQAGTLGLFKAIEMYDPEIALFSTYAYQWISQNISRYVTNSCRNIRIPVHYNDLYTKIKRIIEKENMSLINYEVIAEKLNMETKEIQKCYTLCSSAETVSLNSKVNPDTDDFLEFGDQFISSENVEEVALRKYDEELIDNVLKTYFSERQNKVIRMRFGIAPYDRCYTLNEIGDIYGITRERVRQIEEQCLKRMKKSYKLQSILKSING